MAITNVFKTCENEDRTQKTNEKQTKKTPFEKGEFVGFAINEQKKEQQKNYKEILKNHPEIYKVIEQNEKLKKENESLIDENIQLGEQIERLSIRLQNGSGDVLKKQINKLIHELGEITASRDEIYEQAQANIKTFEQLHAKHKALLKAYNDLKQKRGVTGVIRDKASINFYAHENAELRQKLERVGRVPITNDQIKRIIELYKEGLGYDRISQRTQVSKSTVSKYIQRYLKGELDK